MCNFFLRQAWLKAFWLQLLQGVGKVCYTWTGIFVDGIVQCMYQRTVHYRRNGFYGELWASLMHREFHPWLQNVCSSSSSTNVGTDDCIAIKEPSSCIDNVIQAIHGPEKTPSKSSNCDSVPEERGVSQDDPPSEAELPGVMHSSLLSWKSLDPVKRRLVYDICPKV